jgi:single-strand DNA-binding protein
MAIPHVVVGNLTDDPTLRFGPTGTAWLTFTIAENEVSTGKNGEKTESTFFYNCKMFGEAAEQFVASCSKGMRVIAVVKNRQEKYQDKEGNPRTATTYVVQEIGPSLRWATATVNRISGNGGGAPRAAASQAPAADVEFDGGENPFI